MQLLQGLFQLLKKQSFFELFEGLLKGWFSALCFFCVYCNLFLPGLPRTTIQPLQRVMNAAARVIIMALSTHDHVKPTLKQLHWLPVEQRISYKLCLLMHYIHTSQAPQYLSNCVSTISSPGNRYRLGSSDTADYVLPRTRTRFGERGFQYSGPAAC